MRDDAARVNTELTADAEAGVALPIGMGRIKSGRQDVPVAIVRSIGKSGDPREEQAYRMSRAYQRSNRRIGMVVSVLLPCGKTGAQTAYRIHVRSIVGNEKLANIWREPLQIPLLAEGVNRIYRKRAFPAPGDTGARYKGSLGNPYVDVFEVVCPRAANVNPVVKIGQSRVPLDGDAIHASAESLAIDDNTF